jgi:hypothetical protein
MRGALVTLALVSAAFVAGTAQSEPPGGPLPFKVVETGGLPSVTTERLWPDRIPGIRIAVRDKAVYVKAVAGPYPNTGYSLGIDRLALPRTQTGKARDWCVVLHMSSLPASVATGQLITNPFQTVLVRRRFVGRPVPQAWVLFDRAGHLLGTNTAAVDGKPAGAPCLGH